MTTFQELSGELRFKSVINLFEKCNGDAMMFGMSMMCANVGTAESETIYSLCHALKHAEHEIELLRMVKDTDPKIKNEVLLKHGWEESNGRYVKTQWLSEPSGGPNWYRTEGLDDAYLLHLRDSCND